MNTMWKAISITAAVSFGTAPLHAQCDGWDERFTFSGFDGRVNAVAVFDDGSGPANVKIGRASCRERVYGPV